MIAALYAETNGCYYGLPDVDPWDIHRDARLYDGPWPVVAHPPCDRWCQMAPVNQARYGHRVGDDGGCFAAALNAVRTFGGVLEHPAESLAWPAFYLVRPPRWGWARIVHDDGWVCQIAQRNYGHRARQADMALLYRRHVVGALGMKKGSRPGGADRLTGFLLGKGLSPFASKELMAVINAPIKFRHPGGGNLAYGYPATISAADLALLLGGVHSVRFRWCVRRAADCEGDA